MDDAELIARLRKPDEWTNTRPYFYAHPKILEAADRIQALTAEVWRLRKLLQRNIENEPCRLDHHGYCQTHYLEEDCSVAAARAALQSQEKMG